MGLTAGAFYTAGGFAALAVILCADFPQRGPRDVLLLLAAGALVGGALLLAVGRYLPRGAFHGVVGLGTVLITLAVPLCPTAATALAVTTVYAFVALDVVFFFGWLQGSAHLAALFAAAWWALHDRPEVTAGVGIALAVVCTVVTTVVGLLVRVASNANHDALTGLLNRRGFDRALDTALTGHRGEPLAAVLLDVDHFKTVNDRRGHAAGDHLLQTLARELQGELPEGAVLARYGGDEFALLLPGHSGTRALEVVERARRSCTAQLSAGIAELLPGQAAADLLRHADAALYGAKTAGRGRSRLHDDASVELARELAVAIGAGHVRAWFQPIVSPSTGDVVGVEALARWVHPDREIVSPAEFVPVAETTGLIFDMGLAVLADACRGAREVSDAWGRDLLLTVNVSGRELTSENYPQRVLEIVRASGWSADLLVVEVTESLLDGSSGQALAALEDLRAHGVSVAIDDFGTGYSAFSRLDTLPADYLKLDNVFMADITSSPRRAGMLQALISLAHTLGLQVVAEGVETREQADLVVGMGGTLAQGWLFGRPVPPADLAAAPPDPVGPAEEWLAALDAPR